MMLQAQIATKKQYDQYDTIVYYVSDWVWLSTYNLHIPSTTKSKLGQRWLGPFQVQTLAGLNAIHTSGLPDFLTAHPKFNLDLLKPAAVLPQAGSGLIGTSQTLNPGPTGPSSSPISGEKQNIECILREHSFRGKRLFWGEHLYLLHQHGYTPSANCWILLADMGKAHKQLKAWEDKKPPYIIVQDARETFLQSITIGFEPEHFIICIVSNREQIDQVA